MSNKEEKGVVSSIWNRKAQMKDVMNILIVCITIMNSFLQKR